MMESKNIETTKKSDTEALLGEGATVPVYKRPLVWFLALIVLLGAGTGYYFFGGKDSSKVSYVTAKSEKGNLVVEVSANGTINPVRTVTIGSELSGIVRDVKVDVNDEVKKVRS